MPRGENLHCMFRTGKRRYHSRPPANCKAARGAWDDHAKSGPIVWLQLLDGYWGAKRPPSSDDPDGRIDEIENC
jgi:hypothetical protein